MKASDAFLAMSRFLSDYSLRLRPETALVTIRSAIEVEKDGMSGDPAALSDWLECLETVSRGATDFRPLSDLELAMLQKLLSAQSSGRDALLGQVPDLTARQIDGQGSLKFGPLFDVPRADVAYRVPVEAELDDSDDIPIHVSLHVVNGLIDELEIYREDSSSIQRDLSPDEFRLVVL